MKFLFSKSAAANNLSNAYSKTILAGFTLAVTCGDAFAQGASTKGTLQNVFVWAYGLVGTIGALILLFQIINAKAGNFFNVQDPRKQILMTLLYVGLALAVVGIIQAVKAMVGASGGDIGSL